MRNSLPPGLRVHAMVIADSSIQRGLRGGSDGHLGQVLVYRAYVPSPRISSNLSRAALEISPDLEHIVDRIDPYPRRHDEVSALAVWRRRVDCPPAVARDRRVLVGLCGGDCETTPGTVNMQKWRNDALCTRHIVGPCRYIRA